MGCAAMHRRRATIWLLALAMAPTSAHGDEERASLHYQATVATQYHPAFHADFSGPNSLRPVAEGATSVVMDLFAAVRLWPGADACLQPELSGGRGLSGTLGVAAFPSGEVYRVGDPTPAVTVARFFLRQTIGLGGGLAAVEPGPNQLAGHRDRDALTLTIGKVAVPDFVDVLAASNDPHTHFMSWGLFASGAYDYPADTHGYTWGAAADLAADWWSLRAGLFLEPRSANGMRLEPRVGRSRGLVAEAEVRWRLAGRPGSARALTFLNVAPMGRYSAAMGGAPPDVIATRAAGRTKSGAAASASQELADGLTAFARASFNDGRTETWAFTEVDRSLAAGVVQGGGRWGRPDDEAGAGVVVSGLSAPHRRYLAAGGQGFMLGDGALRFAPEILGELYYRLALTPALAVGGAYQPILAPGYDSARGPVHVVTARVHAAF